MTDAIIMAAPNGARRMPADHPAMPITPEATAAEAARCRAAGAALLHLHVREPDGRHSLDPGRYREAMAAVSEAAPDMLIQITTEAAGRYGPAEQAATLRAVAPRAASVALREMVPDRESEPDAARLYAWAAETRTHIQHIVYAPEELARLAILQRAGVIPAGRQAVIFVLGAYSPPRAGRPEEAAAFLSAAAEAGLELDCALCAFGRDEHACVAEALRLGCHARVGFENNLALPDGASAAGTHDLVALAANAAAELGRGPADPAAAARILGLRPE
ncbi:MAG: 3-keto-5-aminohexanoate cleavage protein [Pseudomonadota bacterium]